MIDAMGLRGLVATLTVEGAVDAEVFNAYAERVLGPALRRGNVMVLDNLTAQRTSRIEEAAEAREGALFIRRGRAKWDSDHTFCYRGRRNSTREAIQRGEY